MFWWRVQVRRLRKACRAEQDSPHIPVTILTNPDRSIAHLGMSVRIGQKAYTQRYPLLTALSCNFVQ